MKKTRSVAQMGFSEVLLAPGLPPECHIDYREDE